MLENVGARDAGAQSARPSRAGGAGAGPLPSLALLNLCAIRLLWVLPGQVAVVVDPIQSVKGKVVIDAFRWESCGATSVPHGGSLLL